MIQQSAASDHPANAIRRIRALATRAMEIYYKSFEPDITDYMLTSMEKEMTAIWDEQTRVIERLKVLLN